MDSKPSLSVVIPVYNGEASLRLLVQRLEPVLRSIAREFELLLVNDDSRDGSWPVVTELARAHPWIRGFDLMRNYGQHNAILLGIREARHEIVVTMDDDLQHPPEEIPKLLAALTGGGAGTGGGNGNGNAADVVYGTPAKERHGLLRDVASLMTKLVLQKSMGVDAARKVSAFRVFRASLRGAFADYRGQYVSIDVLLTWGTTRFRAVTVQHDPRRLGVTNYTFRKLLTHAFNMITGFSVMPLQIASGIGFLFTLLGLALLTYVVAIKLVYGSPVQGFTFIASMVAIFSGAQLFALGIMGEYLARMHFRMMDKPTYAIRGATAEAPTGAGAGAAEDRGPLP